jgi:hypothetical protein
MSRTTTRIIKLIGVFAAALTLALTAPISTGQAQDAPDSDAASKPADKPASEPASKPASEPASKKDEKKDDKAAE